jgi:hypothetical protein
MTHTQTIDTADYILMYADGPDAGTAYMGADSHREEALIIESLEAGVEGTVEAEPGVRVYAIRA